LELARALAATPRLLLLDEWLAGLNPSELMIGIDLIRSLKADGITVVLVEHVMSAVRALCNRCVVMSSGRKIAEGATADVLNDAAVVKAYLGGVAADA
jgi:branched-chain amino acid transport system ATP-binding protein